jgi:hypothetical protein
MPFDFSDVLGCSIRDARLRELFEFSEEMPQPTERYVEWEGRYFMEFPRSGFSLLLTGADIVETVHIYTQSDSEYHAYFDTLPFDLSANTSQAEARDLFGPPTLTGGPVRPVIPSKPDVYWDRWDYESHFFHLQYSEQRDSISLITISSLPSSTTDVVGSA